MDIKNIDSVSVAKEARPPQRSMALTVIGVVLLLVGAVMIWESAGHVIKTKTVSYSVSGVTGGMITPGMPQVMVYDGAIGYGEESVFSNKDIAYEMGSSRSVGIAPPIVSPPASGADVFISDKKIIQNGSIDMLVQDSDVVILHMNSVANAHNGFVEMSTVYERTEGIKSGYATIRVPAESFQVAFTELKTVAVKVVSEQSNTNDVTAQYVDLEAQIKNYKAEEAQYQEIMERATKIEDVLNVASRLSEVRNRIERLEGQLNLLSRQADMSTISVSFTAEPIVKPTDIIWRPQTVIKESVKSLLVGLTVFVDSLIRIAFYVPLLILNLLLVLIGALIVWRFGKVVYKKVIPKSK